MVIFEGCDHSGKSSLSVLFTEYLNNFKDEFDLLRVDPHLGDFIWTKEPVFTSEEADKLNSPEFTDEYKREGLFFESRLRHQEMMLGKNIVCDRYILSGLAYAYLFSPNCFLFAKELYLNPNLFLQPDYYIYVNTPAEICFKRRGQDVPLDRIKKIQGAYEETRKYIRCPIIDITGEYEEQKSLELLIEKFENVYLS